MRRVGLIAAMTVPLLILVAASAALVASSQPSPPVPKHRRRPVAARCTVPPPHPKRPYIGVAPGAPWLAAVARFGQATGTRPGVIENYTPFGSAFNGPRACAVEQLGALPLIQWNPFHASMADITAGRWDRYLTGYARAVREFRNPIVLAFAHEMNGHWFPWGYTHTSPTAYIAAWRHVHRVISAAGARNIIWLWNVNRDIHRSHPGIISPPGEWWPGRAYVDWVGIDAYFNASADRFASVFDVTLAALQRFTHKPVLITETAVGPNPQQAAQIRSLFAGARGRRQVLGFVWFDLNRREHWYIEDRPGAAAAFKRQAAA